MYESLLFLIVQNFGKAFHLVNPSGSMRFADMIATLEAKGYHLKAISYQEWKLELHKQANQLSKLPSTANVDSMNALVPLLSYFSGNFPKGIEHRSNLTKKALRGLNCPLFNRELIARNIDFLKGIGLLLEPS